MRTKEKLILLGASGLAALLLVVFYCLQIYMDYRVPVPYTDRILGIPVVEELDFLEGKKVTYTEENPGVLFGGAVAPYTKDGTVYVAQDFQISEWVGEFSTDSGDKFLCMLPDDAWNTKAESIRQNHIFSLYLVEEDRYYPLQLVVCGMPVMTMTTQRSEKPDKGDSETDPDRYWLDPDVIYYGQMQMFDPGKNTGEYVVTEAEMKYYDRGNSSSHYDKRSFSVGLLDAKGKKLDASLLGMRADNSWKLKAMVQDTSRIREKAACDVWQEFAATNTEVNEEGPHMEFLEVILDNEYQGLYGIVEPVDSKKAGLDKNDVLYKSTSWDKPEDEDIQYAIEREWKIMCFMRIRYPDTIKDYWKTWYPMRDYLNTFYRGGGSGEPEDKIYLSNAIDMALFTMAVSGSDNFFKNMYFAASVDELGYYKMLQLPWDLDMTFGYIWGEGLVDDETVIYMENSIPYLMEKKPELVAEPFMERWTTARETFLSTEHICDILKNTNDYLENAGVVERENNRWPQYTMVPDLEETVDYMERRLDWLDDYFVNEFVPKER